MCENEREDDKTGTREMESKANDGQYVGNEPPIAAQPAIQN